MIFRRLGIRRMVLDFAIRLRPNFAAAHSRLGAVLSEQGKLQEAIGAYRKAIASNPRYARAYSRLGALLMELRQPQEAVEAYRNAIRLDPRISEAQEGLQKAVEESDAHE